MPKQLIIESCFINYGDDAGGVAAVVGETVDVTKDGALELAKYGRALYINKADDPTKTKQFSASPEMVRAIDAAGKAKKSDEAAEAAETVTG